MILPSLGVWKRLPDCVNPARSKGLHPPQKAPEVRHTIMFRIRIATCSVMISELEILGFSRLHTS